MAVIDETFSNCFFTLTGTVVYFQVDRRAVDSYTGHISFSWVMYLQVACLGTVGNVCLHLLLEGTREPAVASINQLAYRQSTDC